MEFAVAQKSTADPWADQVVSYVPGSSPAFGYSDPTTALGEPERFTGEVFGFPSVVSVFSPAFGAEELVSIGEGGSLTVKFNEPITNSPTHKFGADFIVFGNAGLIDEAYPQGKVSTPAAMFGTETMHVSVSADGLTYVPVGAFTEGFFPSQAYLDSGPYDTTPGFVPTDFTIPVNPAFTLSDFSGLTLSGVHALYDGSGGGTPIDISSTGLGSVQYVRIDLPDDGDPFSFAHVEVEALSAVPEPTTALLFGGSTLLFAVRKKRG